VAEAQSTRPGAVNRQRQKVVRKVDWVDGGMDGQSVYVLQCQRPGCGFEYGEEGIRVHQRKCPRCDGGLPGLPVPAAAPTLFG
jgi:predicted Zn-ribbon and HTH transcriptional regulator